jgi:hypothetical protein
MQRTQEGRQGEQVRQREQSFRGRTNQLRRPSVEGQPLTFPGRNPREFFSIPEGATALPPGLRDQLYDAKFENLILRNPGLKSVDLGPEIAESDKDALAFASDADMARAAKSGNFQDIPGWGQTQGQGDVRFPGVVGKIPGFRDPAELAATVGTLGFGTAGPLAARAGQAVAGTALGSAGAAAGRPIAEEAGLPPAVGELAGGLAGGITGFKVGGPLGEATARATAERLAVQTTPEITAPAYSRVLRNLTQREAGRDIATIPQTTCSATSRGRGTCHRGYGQRARRAARGCPRNHRHSGNSPLTRCVLPVSPRRN